MIVAYKNYKRTERALLCITSVRHFLPDVEIHCINLIDEVSSEYDAYRPEFDRLGVKVHFAKNKHKCGPGICSPCNGYYYTEYLNYFNIIFKDKEKVVAMDEDVYFTTGETLRFLRDTNYDFAWATWWVGVNAGILGINFKKMAPLFPLSEKKVYIEIILREELLDRATQMGMSIVKIPTRHEANYFGDGTYTNDTEVIRSDLRRVGIIA
jgi:hypothetical protein